jgi:N-acetyltransferase
VTAVRPLPISLVGQFIRLEPLTESDLPALHRAIGHPLTYAGGFGGGPAGYRESEADFVSWALGHFRWADGNIYGVWLDGGLVGTTTLADFDLEREHTHIGWTAYDRRVWGTAVNPEAKLLLLGLAFDHGFGRVKLQADALNERSRAAILRLGATFEGLVRRDQLRADRTWRDTAVYSVTIDDWPRVKAGLEERLAGAGRAGGILDSWQT